MWQRSKDLARAFKRELVVYRRVLSDARTPRAAKVFLGLAIGYLCMPFDLIPDFIPFFGWLDDAVLVALVLDRLVSLLGRPLLLKHWPFEAASLDATLATARRLAAWVPERLRTRVLTPRRVAA